MLQICQLLSPSGGGTYGWQADQSVPYAYNVNTKLWVGYDDQTSVVAKVRMINPDYIMDHTLDFIASYRPT